MLKNVEVLVLTVTKPVKNRLPFFVNGMLQFG